MTQFSNTFTITKKDNIRYNFFLMQKKLIATSILVFIIVSAMVGILHYAQGAGVTSSILNGLLMAVVGTLVLIGINVAATIMRINGFYKKKQISDFSVTFTTDKSGIHAASDRGDSDLPWARIVAVRETRNAFYIFITDSHANVMPKDQFKDEESIRVFRALLEKNVEKNRLKIKRG